MAGKHKELAIGMHPNRALYFVFFTQGGELPTVLKTDFTSKMEAQHAIDAYYSAKRSTVRRED